MQLGDSFLMRSPGQSFDHLWIVISDPTRHAGTFIIVNLTTNVARAGAECELNKGDHRWVVEKCFVSFADAIEITPDGEKRIKEQIADKTIATHFPLEESVLQRILTAAKTSKTLPVRFKKYL